MTRRVVAAVLWLLTGWYFGAVVATVFDLPTALAPILGIAAAAVVAADPWHVIWIRRSTPASAVTSSPNQAPNPA